MPRFMKSRASLFISISLKKGSGIFEHGFQIIAILFDQFFCVLNQFIIPVEHAIAF